MNFFTNFLKDEAGAVTVDWVVLTAAIVGLGIAVLTTVGNSTVALSTDIATEITTTPTDLWTSS